MSYIRLRDPCDSTPQLFKGRRRACDSNRAVPYGAILYCTVPWTKYSAEHEIIQYRAVQRKHHCIVLYGSVRRRMEAQFSTVSTIAVWTVQYEQKCWTVTGFKASEENTLTRLGKFHATTMQQPCNNHATTHATTPCNNSLSCII